MKRYRRPDALQVKRGGRYEPISHGRYFMPTVAVIFAAIGVLCADLLPRAGGSLPARWTRSALFVLVSLVPVGTPVEIVA